ncbi:hypothetical protein CTAYLR_010313 [Chrysophaeum taylorii]|uniref:Calmodulin n=1 Tax=Chrysophaeum taylorii TaxID=2483200 RepID=A0AAD7XNR6_9STRA|nr:hypothetical protein CTAYLR_010313 [Chrysophaeum taylorii]
MDDKEVRALFAKFDVNGDGSISPAEVQQILHEVGLAATAADAALMVAQVDRNLDGMIEWDEFVAMMDTHGRTTSKLSKVVTKNRENILTVQHGAANSQHSWSTEETMAFTEVVNSRLAGDSMLADRLPIETNGGQSTSLFDACADGVLLCRLINLVDADAVDERAINTKKLSKFKIIENNNLAINAAKDIGCRITNIGAHDVMEARPHLILGLTWQIIRLLLTAKISLTEHPEMARLLEGDETLQMLLALPPERILVRWVNYHLKAAGSDRRISALGRELSDSVVYATLMKQLYGPQLRPVDLSGPLDKRAAGVLSNAEGVGVKPFIKPGDIVSGNAKLNLAFTAQLFNDRHGLAPLDDDDLKGLADLDIDDAGDTREARTFKLWLNSLNLVDHNGEVIQVNDLFRELCNGLPILSVMDHIKAGSVPWRKVVRDPKNRHHLVENGNHVVEAGKQMDLVLVNIGGLDIADGNKKLILAVMWQLMRRATVDLLSSLKGDGSKVEEPELVAWANAKVAAFAKPAGPPSPPIKTLGDKSLSTSVFLIDLCAAVSPETVNWDLVTPGKTDEDATLNARYALSIARKIGAGVFCAPEDIVEVRQKMILLFIAAIWQAEATGGRPQQAAPPAIEAPPPRRAVPPVPARRASAFPAPPPRSVPEVPAQPKPRAAPPPPARPEPARAAPPPPARNEPAPTPPVRAPAAPPAAAPSRATPPAPPKRDTRKPLPPGAPKNYARAPPPPKTQHDPHRRATTTGFEVDSHVVQLQQPTQEAYKFKSVNGTGETGALESNDVEDDEWD